MSALALIAIPRAYSCYSTQLRSLTGRCSNHLLRHCALTTSSRVTARSHTQGERRSTPERDPGGGYWLGQPSLADNLRRWILLAWSAKRRGSLALPTLLPGISGCGTKRMASRSEERRVG